MKILVQSLNKVIATQPFNKHSKYGISFISLTGPPKIEPKVEPKKEQVSSLGAFKLKDESESDIYIGSYFARKKENQILSSPSPSTVAAVMRSDTTLAEMTLHAGQSGSEFNLIFLSLISFGLETSINH